MAIWRGWDRSEIPALKSLLGQDFEGALEILVPTSGSAEKGAQRLAKAQALCAARRNTTQKLVTTGDTQADCCSALLAAADGEIVVLIDGSVELPSGSALRELLRWASLDRAGVVTTALKSASDALVANTMDIGRDGVTLYTHATPDGSAVVDGMLPQLMAVSSRKAAAAGGIDAIRFPDAFWPLEFCLRLRQSGYYSMQVCHIVATTQESVKPPATSLPLQTRVLLLAADLLGP